MGGELRSGKAFGFILDYLHGYQEGLWRQAYRRAETLGASLFTFVGGSLGRGSESDIEAQNQVFAFSRPSYLDGFLLSGSTLGSYIDPEEYSRLLRPYSAKPCSSIGPCPLPIPSVRIENSSGISRMVEHLASQHGKRRIAFISGPPGSQEARERLLAYHDGLKKAGLALDENYVYQGNFWYDSGKAAICEFLDKRHLDFDAVIAANDYMAIGAMRELLARGRQVPGELSVTGYDDSLESLSESPSLTTVRQPIQAQADMAVDILMGKPVSQAALPTEQVLRRSCGCVSMDQELAGHGGVQRLRPELPQARELLSDVLQFSSFSPQSRQDIEGLTQDCLSRLAGKDFEGIYKLTEAAVYRAHGRDEALGQWQNLVSTLRTEFLPYCQAGQEQAQLENTWGRLRVLISSMDINRLNASISRDADFQETIGATLKATARAISLTELAQLFRDSMPRLGLRSFYFALRQDGERVGPVEPDEGFCLLAAYCDGNDPLLGAQSPPFKPSEFIPPNYLPRRACRLLVLPLCYNNDFYGFAAYEPGPLQGNLYTRINDQLTASIKTIYLLERARRAEISVEAKAERVESLVRPMTEAIQEVSRTAIAESQGLAAVGEASRQTKRDLGETQARIGRLADAMRKVDEFVRLIEGTSSTTNLLGLNAAIEAARAGNQGKGFGVIAMEIRKLAATTQENAELISRVLAEFRREAEASVGSVGATSQAFANLDVGLERVMGALVRIGQRTEELNKAAQELRNTM